MPSLFPLEIEETILDFLAEDDRDHSDLKMCSLVCQAFLHICRKHIFGDIVLNRRDAEGSSPRPTSHAFERLLRETPEIANFVHKLDFTIRYEDVTNPSIQESLKLISKVEFLTVRSSFWILSWSNSLIRPALLHLLHLPTLTHFKMEGIYNFLISDLIPSINLKYLGIVNMMSVADETTFPGVFPERSIQLNEFDVGFGNAARAALTIASIMKLCTARRPDGQPIIDFRSLSKITVPVAFTEANDEFLRDLFRHCPFLTNVDININCK